MKVRKDGKKSNFCNELFEDIAFNHYVGHGNQIVTGLWKVSGGSYT
ncbi:MAG: hypothetical protein Q4P25_03445 [Tissierellia bacterium]|nr:hypothetical protein [Tissierellia bacterium]